MEKNRNECPAEALLRILSGKWKAQIMKKAMDGPLRFNALLRELKEANKQSLSVALKDLEDGGLLVKQVVKEKPLHIEYSLTEKGLGYVEVFKSIEKQLLA